MGSVHFPPANEATTPHFERSVARGSAPGAFFTTAEHSPLFDGGAWGATKGGAKTPGLDPDSRTPAGGRQDGSTRTGNRTPGRPSSLFYHDLATPHRRGSTPGGSLAGGGSTTPGQNTPFWNRGAAGPGSMPPPPPCETLGDHLDRSPEIGTPPVASTFGGTTPEYTGSGGGGLLSPPGGSFNHRNSFNAERSLAFGASSLHSGMPAGSSGVPMSWEAPSQSGQSASAMWISSPTASRATPSGWTSPPQNQGWRGGGAGERSPLVDSPVAGVMHDVGGGGLLTMPPPQESVRPGGLAQTPGRGLGGGGESSEDKWVTVFGFGADDVNTVMREFEKCGVVTSHVYGPGGANWLHIHYQSNYDAQKALAKNGIQLTGNLIVGVKWLEPHQRALVAGSTSPGQRPPSTGPLMLGKSGGRSTAPSLAATRPYHLEPRATGGQTAGIAQPSKSTFTKVWDFIFGM